MLLVGDSAGNNVFGYETTIPVTVDELIPLVRAVARAARRALVVARPAVRLLPGSARAGARHGDAVHEGGRRARGQARGRPALAPAVEPLTALRHPRDGAHRLHPAERARARRLPRAGPRRRRPRWSRTPSRSRRPALSRSCWRWCRPTWPAGHRGAAHPHHRHRRRPDCDAQVLVWQDMAGLRTGTSPRFVKHYADLRTTLTDAARAYAEDVAAARSPRRSTPSSPDPARALDVTHVGVASERVPSRPAGCGGSRGGQPQVPGDLGHGAVLLVHDRVLPVAEQWSGLDLIANRSGTVRWSATEPCAAASLPLRGPCEHGDHDHGDGGRPGPSSPRARRLLLPDVGVTVRC